MFTFVKNCKVISGRIQKCKVLLGRNQKKCKVFLGRVTLRLCADFKHRDTKDTELHRDCCNISMLRYADALHLSFNGGMQFRHAHLRLFQLRKTFKKPV